MTGHPAPEVFAAMLHAVDDLDWEAVRASFTPEVATDYTSLWGGEPATISADELVTWWRELAPGYDATQHLIGPFVVTRADDRSVTCTTNVRAYHHLIEPAAPATWLVVGRYVVTLTRGAEGWTISGVALRTAYEEGDRQLVELAKARVAAGSGGRVAG